MDFLDDYIDDLEFPSVNDETVFVPINLEEYDIFYGDECI